jgi:dUTP pyrophosphatase
MSEPAYPVLVIKAKLLRDGARLPIRQPGDAGFDLYYCPDLIHRPADRSFGTGLAVEIPYGWCGILKGRSSLANDYGLAILGGVIDSSYRGEVRVLFNYQEDYEPEPGDRIAQMLIFRVPQVKWIETDILSQTNRGPEGLGSTGR